MKIRIAIFFSLLFVSLLVAPAIISLTDDYSKDIALLLDNNEEEENNGKEESILDTEFKIHSSVFITSILNSKLSINKNICFFTKNYNSANLKITTPPPKTYKLIHRI